MLIGILKNQNPDSVRKWEIACQQHQLEYRVIELISNSWMKDISKEPFNFFVHRPPGDIERYKQLFDERLFIMSEVMGINIFPSFIETIIYENKKLLSYYLKANDIPHAETYVFYNYLEAQDFIRNTNYPKVAKSNIGAAGSGVEIIKTKMTAKKYIHKAFKGKGIRRRFGPNRVTGTPKKWFIKAIQNPEYFKTKLKSYFKLFKDSQYGYVIFQEFVPHDFEWRVAKIGESYFAYKKFKLGDKASGAKSLGYENPPFELLDFVRNIATINNINSAAFDIFISNGSYLVNEIQTIFGHINDHILEVNGLPGRYLFQNNQWVFEKGNFNTNESYDLRLETALKLYQTKE